MNKVKALKIALDYDETFTKDPWLWQMFVAAAKERGHEVKIVTSRYKEMTIDNEQLEECADVMGIDIIYTGMEQKSYHYEADIWLDDYPVIIPKHPLLYTYSRAVHEFSEDE